MTQFNNNNYGDNNGIIKLDWSPSRGKPSGTDKLKYHSPEVIHSDDVMGIIT